MNYMEQEKRLDEFIESHEMLDWFICPNEHPEVEFVDHINGTITINGKRHKFMMSHDKEWFVAK